MANVIKQLRLINVDSVTNMNRFWEGRLYDNGDFESIWGRVGAANPQSKMFPGGGDSKFEEMRRDKSKKGYTELKTVGGSSVPVAAQVQDVGRTQLREIAKAQIIKSNNPTLSKLIDRLVEANVHRITSSTQITFNSATGLFSTPLGIVTPDGIGEARNLLVTLNQCVSRRDWTSGTMSGAVNQYLRIVPQNVGMKRFDASTLFPDTGAIQKQSDVLDSLEASYQALQTSAPVTPTSKPMEQVFKVDLDLLKGGNEYDRLNSWYEKSKKDMHNYGAVRVRQIYTVNIHTMTNTYEDSTLPHQQVFHGSSQANCLSILKSGLKVNPPNTAAIAGKMFGSGIYGAINSSKSLGYTFGRWGQGGTGDAGWLFVCSFAMGRTYIAHSSCNKPSGYDSIWAKAGSGLYNDELIVFRNSQVKITHLLECK